MLVVQRGDQEMSAFRACEQCGQATPGPTYYACDACWRGVYQEGARRPSPRYAANGELLAALADLPTGTYEKRMVVEGYVLPNDGQDWPEMKVEGANRGGLDFAEMVPREALDANCPGSKSGPDGTFEIIVRYTPKAKP